MIPVRTACYLYDAVLLYVNAVSDLVASSNKTIEEVVEDGTAIIGHILGRKYKSEWLI